MRILAVGTAVFYVGIAAGVAVLAYAVGRSAADEEINDLRRKMEDMQHLERDAAVVHRVSQQMEDIAYQQKAISDMQRSKAEEQTHLANEMRVRAEQESRIARESQQKAVLALDEAERQRFNAMEQEKRAIDQLHQTQLQKSITDTMSYRMLGRSLGSASMAQYESGNRELASLLAYASWHFVNQYKGNSYLPESYSALSRSSGLQKRFIAPSQGEVSAIIPLTADDGCVVATRFGEIVKWIGVSAKPRMKVLFNEKDQDFRSLLLDTDGTIWALTVRGMLYVIPPVGKPRPYMLPSDKYLTMSRTDKNTIVLFSQRGVAWFDTKSHKVTGKQALSHQLSAVCRTTDNFNMYFTNQSHAVMDAGGKIVKRQQPVPGTVTAAYHSANLGVMFLGMADGTIYAVNPIGQSVDLSSHRSAITSIAMDNDILISTSYDRRAYLWNLPRLRYGNNVIYWKSNLGYGNFERSQSNISEWLTPAEYVYEGWPLCVSVDNRLAAAWIGTSGGVVQRVPTSVDKMAKTVRGKLSRELTDIEWDSYIGSTVPKISFRKK